MIKQLKKSQFAITDGLKDIVESNKDVMTLNTDLPQLAIEQPPKESRLY